MLICQNACKTGNNAVKTSHAFQEITRLECLRDLNLSEYVFTECHSKLGNGWFTILFDGAYFLLAVMVEGDESSQLKRAN